MRYLFGILFLMISTFAGAAVNLFDPFLGEYEIESRLCTVDAKKVEPCAEQVGEVKVEYDESGILRMYDVFTSGGHVGYPIYEVENEEAYGSTSAKVYQEGQDTVTWEYNEKVQQFSGPESRRTKVLRTLQKVQGKLEYRVYRRVIDPYTGRSVQTRRFVLHKKL